MNKNKKKLILSKLDDVHMTLTQVEPYLEDGETIKVPLKQARIKVQASLELIQLEEVEKIEEKTTDSFADGFRWALVIGLLVVILCLVACIFLVVGG